MSVELNYCIIGDGVFLILFYGLFGLFENFGGIVCRLQDVWQIYVLDQCNYGGLLYIDVMDYFVMVVDVIVYFDCQGIDKVWIFGYFMGGKVVMQVVFQVLEWVEKIVVVDIVLVSYKFCYDVILEGFKSLDLQSIWIWQEVDVVFVEYVEMVFIC